MNDSRLGGRRRGEGKKKKKTTFRDGHRTGPPQTTRFCRKKGKKSPRATGKKKRGREASERQPGEHPNKLGDPARKNCLSGDSLLRRRVGGSSTEKGEKG